MRNWGAVIGRVRLALVLAGLAVGLGACLDVLAWSPDGRWLGYASGEKGRVWLWDSAARTMAPVGLRLENSTDTVGEICSLKFVPGCAAAVLQENGGNKLYWCELGAGRGTCRVIDEHHKSPIDVTPWGSVLYLKEGAKGGTDCWSYTGGQSRRLWGTSENLEYLALSPGGDRLLLSSGDELLTTRLDGSGTQRFFPQAKGKDADTKSEGEHKYYAPEWVDENHVVYIQKHTDEFGELWMSSLDGKTSEALLRNVYILSLPAVNRAARLVAVAALPAAGDTEPQKAGDVPLQIAQVDLVTGGVSWLTDETQSACNPAYAPDGARVAYQVKQDDAPRGLVKIVNQRTAARETCWMMR